MIKDCVLLQKRELEEKIKEQYINRGIDIKRIKNPLIKVIIGPRRSGKSFSAMHILKSLGLFGYVNFDDERLVIIKDYNEIITAVMAVYPNAKTILFDEIQNLDKWELFVNRLQRQGYNLIITGSNSKLLSKELATHLTGRHSVIIIFPFSFREIINYDAKELTEAEKKEKLTEYLEKGGYPEIIIKKVEGREYLSTLFHSLLYKDIVKRFKIRSVQGIEDLALYILSNITKEFSYNTLTKVTACKSVHTVDKYLGYLEEAFLFFRVKQFSFKFKEQLLSKKKIYCIDNGFISTKAFAVSRNIGQLCENSVAIVLKKEEMNGKCNFYYWKNQQAEEVDFIVKKGRRIDELIQVCYDSKDPKTKEREIRALLKASKELKCNSLTIITYDHEEEAAETWFGIKRKVCYVPLWKWLLQREE